MAAGILKVDPQPTGDKADEKHSNETAKRFFEILDTELGEIEKLQSRRHWHDPAPAKKLPKVIEECAREIKQLLGFETAGQPKGAQPGQDSGTGTASCPAPTTAVPGAAPDAPARQELNPDVVIEKAHEGHLLGLAFSGGGIRSATFNLGVLQTLADLDLLKRFDYLSTVSGGGYIGSWLAAWIKRCGIEDVTRNLQTDRKPNANHREAEPIRFLRRYSNYLTPRLGFFSLDTWSMIATYLRNTLLNLTILVFSLAVVLLLPHAGEAVNGLRWASGQGPLLWGGVFLLLMVQFVAGNLESRFFGPPGIWPFASVTHRLSAQVAGATLLPAAWFLSIWVSRRNEPHGLAWVQWAEHGALTYFLLWLLAWAVAWVTGLGSRLPTRIAYELSRRLFKPPHARRKTAIAFRFGSTIGLALILLLIAGEVVLPFHDWLLNRVPTFWVIGACMVLSLAFLWTSWRSRRREVPDRQLESIAMLFATPWAGALGGVLLGGLVPIFNSLQQKNWGSFHFLVVGTPLVVVVLLLVAALHVGLMGLMLRNQKREWWSRFGGWVLVLALTWLVVCGLSLYAFPCSNAYGATIWGRLVKWGLTPAWVLSTVGGVLAGKSKDTGQNQKPWLEWAAGLTPYVFVLGMLAGLSYFMSWAFTSTQLASWVNINHDSLGHFLPARYCEGSRFSYLPELSADMALRILGIAAGCFGIAAFLAWRVDINDFSMHLFYRNRLVRCYLGASHGKARRYHPFTGFDRGDDMVLKEMRAESAPKNLQADSGYSGPLLIINAALNLVKGKELAWQERKAASFVFTPLYCGFDAWLEKLETPDAYAYRPTERYGYPDGGMFLGTAMSISGAAASPCMGYHSKPALAFLMTVFNVRLGWWAGNPRRSTWQRPSPLFGLGCLLSELCGTANDESRYVYLSDGGHFENLGIYELVKRRCKYIVACDASEDHKYAFSDLGNAIRKCRQDIGVEIKINTDQIALQRSGKNSVCHCAVGEIHYEKVDPKTPADSPGLLIYLKCSLTGDEPADVLNYKTNHDEFPHQSTANQWFNESQFESYRRLGQHIAWNVFETVWHKGGGRTTPEEGQNALRNLCNKQLFEELRKSWPSKLGN